MTEGVRHLLMGLLVLEDVENGAVHTNKTSINKPIIFLAT